LRHKSAIARIVCINVVVLKPLVWKYLGLIGEAMKVEKEIKMKKIVPIRVFVLDATQVYVNVSLGEGET
jgi:hypothetical protein